MDTGGGPKENDGPPVSKNGSIYSVPMISRQAGPLCAGLIKYKERDTLLGEILMSSDSNGLANPVVLGLYGFALAVILLSVHNLGFFGMDATIMAAAVFMGGIAQLIAGLMEFKRNTMFTGTVFTLLGLFWIAFGVLQAGALGAPAGVLGSPEHTSLSTFFLIFTILVVFMTFGTFKSPKSFIVTFVLIDLTLILLTSGAFLEMEALTKAGGAFGILAGAGAVYIASAEMYAEQYKKQILPL